MGKNGPFGNWIITYAVGIAMGVGIGIAYESRQSLLESVSSEDRNGDGLSDFVIGNSRGDKIIFLAKKDDSGNINYEYSSNNNSCYSWLMNIR